MVDAHVTEVEAVERSIDISGIQHASLDDSSVGEADERHARLVTHAAEGSPERRSRSSAAIAVSIASRSRFAVSVTPSVSKRRAVREPTRHARRYRIEMLEQDERFPLHLTRRDVLW